MITVVNQISFKITMMKKYIYVLTISLLIIPILSCQSIYKAQKQMDKYNYAKAEVILKKVATKEKTHDAAMPMLADCYRLQRDLLNAKSAYAEVVTFPNAKPESFYYYAQALQSTGEYAKAREMFQKYAVMNPTDPRGSMYAAHCDSVLGPWKGMSPAFEVKMVNGINTDQSDFGPAFYNGELVFASDFNTNPGEAKEYGWTGRGYLNIMKSSPDTAGNFWGNMGKASGFNNKINQEYHDGPATFSADGNNIYFTRSFFGKAKREGIYKTNLLKIYYATKTQGEWGEIKPFFLNSKEYSVGHPTLSANGDTLYFVSDMPGGQGETDIWMCKKENEAWGPPINLGKTINTSEKEMFPTLCSNGDLYFASTGHPGYGALDIFKTRNENGTWTTPENLHPPINSSFDDFAIAFESGEKNGFFSSNRPEGMGSDDIYAFRVAEPAPVLPAYISGLVLDKTTLQPLTGATVFLYDPETGNVKILKTDTAGTYKAALEKPGEYMVKAMMTNYISDCSPITITEVKPGTNTVIRNLLLDKLIISKTFRIENIYYDFDKYNIRADAKPELDKLVRIMNENRVNVEIGSHTDCRGPVIYNDKLSQNRAEAAVKYIISTGIDKGRITAKGFGEHQLINKCADGVICTSKEHQANRRTEFRITSVAALVVTPDQIDPSIYLEGQMLPFNTLPADFFMKCR
jgi:outer membrane protein OmpA-like peptidoglycan-associated protein/tetratricopeptide (TPR) repeat protein